MLRRNQMTDVFSQSEKAAARREKKILFWTWFAITAAYVALMATLIATDLVLVSVHRNRNHTLWMGALSMLATVAYVCFTLFFFSIKYRLTRKYVRMLRDMDRGLKDTFEGRFMGYDDAIGMKDGVYFYSMLLKTRPLRRDDIDERKLLIEHTVPKIELNEGDKLRLVSHANILISYEILERAPVAEKAEENTQNTDDAPVTPVIQQTKERTE